MSESAEVADGEPPASHNQSGSGVGPPTTSPVEAAQDPILRLVSRNPLATWATVAFLLFAANALSVAHGSGTNALALVTTTSVQSTIIGLALALIPYAAATTATMLWLLMAEGGWEHVPGLGTAPLLGVTAIAATVAAAFLAPWTTFVLFVLFTAWGLRTIIRLHRRGLRAAKAATLLYLLPIGVTGIYLVMLGTMWLPTERLTLASGVEVAYVLRDDGRWVGYLRDSDREVIWTHSQAVLGREVCGVSPEWWNVSLLQFIYSSRGGSLPPCQTPSPQAISSPSAPSWGGESP